jgi:Subtilase family/Calx-beta domain
VGIPANVDDLFQQSHSAGARVQSISWGSEAAGEYTDASAGTDGFVWTHRNMTIAMSAGNSGADSDSDGVVDEMSVTSPATAKNVITVGASENDRQSHWECDTALTYSNCAAQGGQNLLFTYGAGFPDRFAANPLYDDPSAGDAQQMAAFSSRGPTSDGRIKPDVVAPGTWILSGYSDRFQQQYDASPNPQNGAYQYDGWGYPLNSAYKYMGGTSMAAPLVAGGAAVVRDFYEKAHQHQASAALVKATLINSAVDLLDENNDGVADNAFPVPNIHEGWGRIDLARATDGSHQFADESVVLSTDERATFAVTVASPAPRLKISLVWTDYPSTPSASRALVNDLDLKVVAPDGTIYLGNAFSGGWSVAGGGADRINNVENVFVASPVPGAWSVSVRGFNVPFGPQSFALVVEGASEPLGAPEIAPAPPTLGVTAVDASATEAGPTDGVFRIARSGDTSAELLVRYAVSGTATPGSDYIALPGEVTLPAGATEATLTVSPLDDEAYESNETVVLTLLSSLAYDVGEPPAATVTVVSDDLRSDLTVTAMTGPSLLAAGDTVTVTETTKIRGPASRPHLRRASISPPIRRSTPQTYSLEAGRRRDWWAVRPRHVRLRCISRTRRREASTISSRRPTGMV